jgi:hypothetical protein
MGPLLSVTPAQHSIANIKTGNSPPCQQLSIVNKGDVNLEISSISLTGPASGGFSIFPGSCGSLTPVIAVGERCTVDVSYIPDVSGSKSAILRITSNGRVFENYLDAQSYSRGMVNSRDCVRPVHIP